MSLDRFLVKVVQKEKDFIEPMDSSDSIRHNERNSKKKLEEFLKRKERKSSYTITLLYLVSFTPAMKVFKGKCRLIYFFIYILHFLYYFVLYYSIVIIFI